MILFTVGVNVCALGIELTADQYYTWGINDDDVTILDGNIITEAVLTMHGITSLTDNSNDALVIYCLDDPPLGFISNIDAEGVDHFKNHGFRLTPDYKDETPGTENLTYQLSEIDENSSWVWKIFDRQFEIVLANSKPVTFSSSLLELIDYAGNGTPFGIGFDPNSTDNFIFDGITLDLTVESFENAPSHSVLTYSYGDTNRPPVLDDIIMVPEIKEGELFTFPVNATDPDGDEITYSMQDSPDNATLTNGIFEWTPSYDLATRRHPYYDTVTFIASDGKLEDSKTVRMRIINTNRPPTIQPIENKSISENEELFFNINATDPDGDFIRYLSPRLPDGAVLENGVFSWTPNYDQAGFYKVFIFALDIQGIDVETVSITVKNTNRPPLFKTINNKTATENETLAFQVYASDPDGDQLTYSAERLPPNAIFMKDYRFFIWNIQSGQTGEHNVTFIASDNETDTRHTVNITVSPKD